MLTGVQRASRLSSGGSRPRGAAPRTGSFALQRETEGRVDQVAADPVLDSELTKPPGAEVDLLGPCLERITEQRPDGRHASPESAEVVARAVVIRHLLIEVAADARGKAKREVLIRCELSEQRRNVSWGTLI